MPAVFNVGAGDVATLIADINIANSNGQSNTINLTKSTYDLKAVNNFWYGPTGLPAISSDLTIHGNGATIERDPTAPAFRLFYVSGGLELSPAVLRMDNVTLEGGLAKGGDSDFGGGGMGAGGAIFNQGLLVLNSVTLIDNTAKGGSSGVTTGNVKNALGGAGMGSDAQGGAFNNDGSGFGGGLGGTFGGTGGAGGGGGGGGGGGFITGANGQDGPSTDAGGGGFAGGLGRFGQGEDGGDGGGNQPGGPGGNFGVGGDIGGGGGGVGGGGGSGLAGSGGDISTAGSGGFGGGGGFGENDGGDGGFGAGGGSAKDEGGLGGFGGGNGGSNSTGTGGGGAGMGGAIFNMGANAGAAPQAILINCTLADNFAQGGNGGPATSPAGSTHAAGSGLGGAIFNVDAQLSLTNCTLANNTVAGGTSAGGAGIADGGAVYNLAFGDDIRTGNAVTASVLMNNSILALSNTGHDLVSQALGGDHTNTATVGGSHNLVMSSSGTIGAGVITLTANPKLGPLQNNGGLTPTLLPLNGSPVLGAGVPGLAPASDQRGMPRPPGGPTDLGSVQVSVSPTPGGGGGGSGSGGAATSAGLIGLAIEEFQLTLDSVLALVEGALRMPHSSLDDTIAQLHDKIANDPLTPTSTGQLAIMLGEGAALNALSGS
ncbi:MAG TPA: choice-of-anchor Q domain-containing protein [Gemmataceae bacterium]